MLVAQACRTSCAYWLTFIKVLLICFNITTSTFYRINYGYYTMSDLFETINDCLQSNSEDGSNSTKIQDSSGVAKTASKPTSKTSTSAAAATSKTTKDKAESKRKSQASTTHSSTSHSSSEKAIDRLAKMVSAGFSELKDLFSERFWLLGLWLWRRGVPRSWNEFYQRLLYLW